MIRLFYISFFLLNLSSEAELAYKFDLINEAHFAEELNYFQIQSTSEIKINKLPEIQGLVWLDTEYSVSNRKLNDEEIKIHKAKLMFFTTKEGLYKFPLIEAKIGEETIYLKAEPLRILPKRNKTEKFVRLLYNGKASPEEFFVGQSVDIEILVFTTAGSGNGINNPSVKLDNARLYKYQKQDMSLFNMSSGSNIFYRFSSGIYQQLKNKKMNGKTWDVRRYKVTAQLMRSGNVSGRILTTLTDKDGRHFPLVNDLEFKVKDIPKLNNKEILDSKLSGKWSIRAEISSEILEVNKSFTYSLKFEGNGDLRRLKLPEFNFPGIKVINSQFTKNEKFANHWEGNLSYTLFPSEKATIFPKIEMSFFNTETKEHEILELSKPIPVIGGSSPKNLSSEKPIASQAESLSEDLRKPLYLNIPPLMIVLFFIAPLIFVCASWLKKFRAKPETKKLKSLSRKRVSLIKKCESADDQQIPALIQNELIPLLIESYKLPVGATVEELIQHVKCETLKKLLIDYNASSYGGKKLELCPNRLKKAINTLSITLFLVFCGTAMAGSSSEKKLTEANTAFSKTNYEASIKLYKELLKEHPNNASVHFNLGNAYFKNNELNKARASYHSALLLDPSHQGSKKNLKHLNEKTEYTGPPGNPLNILRSDQWLVVFIITWSLFWILLTVLKLKKKRLKETVYCGIGCLSLLAVVVYYQIAVSYATGRYQVISQYAHCFDKPGSLNKELNKIPLGTEFIILKESNQYALVQSEGQHFWLKIKDLQKVW